MDMEKEEILANNAREYFNSGKEELEKGRNNSSVVLFFKALISLADLYVLKKTGKAPSSHKERFRVLQRDFIEVYNLVDKDFPFYQDSYVQMMSRELAEVIKNDAEIMGEKTEVKL